MVDPFGFNLYYKDATARLGEGTKIWQFASVQAGVVTGKNCVIGSGAWVGDGTVMGDNCHIQHGAFIARKTKMGNNVFIGPLACLADDKYPAVGNKDYNAEPPILEDACSIGAGAVICPGVRIGKGVTVGAGAVVTTSIPDFTVVVGIPAREL